MDVDERDVIVVKPDAIASRFYTRWLVSPARSSWLFSAFFVR
jgi:hypothetical protein